MKNIGWHTRSGHLDFFAKLSSRLKEKGNDICSHYICHSKAEEKNLKDKYNITPWNLGDYLEERKKTFHLSEDTLSELEDKYNLIPLRRLLWSEMYEKGFKEHILIFHLVAHIEFWEKFLTENRIDCMVSERPSILSTSVLWMLCKKHNIQFVDFINIGIDGRIVFTSSWYGDIDYFEDKYRTIEIDEMSETYRKTVTYLEKMTTLPEKPKYIFKNLQTGDIITSNELYKNFPKMGNIFKLPRRIKHAITSRAYYTDTITEEYLSIFMLHLRSVYHRLFHIFEKNVDLTKERYFLFPLHILHEWSNYPWMGLKYPNTVSVVSDIVSCIPLGSKLYVKEHTTNFPEKSISFYRAIKRHQQVRLIDRFEDTYKLLRNSGGVITLGGTIGWEAFLIGKAVVILGEAWYKHLPGVYKAKSIEHLTALLQGIKKLPLATKEDKIKAIYALFELSFEAQRYPIVDLITAENIERYIEPFESWLRDNVGVSKSG